jgi:hypothetical protein
MVAHGLAEIRQAHAAEVRPAGGEIRRQFGETVRTRARAAVGNGMVVAKLKEDGPLVSI